MLVNLYAHEFSSLWIIDRYYENNGQKFKNTGKIFVTDTYKL